MWVFFLRVCIARSIFVAVHAQPSSTSRSDPVKTNVQKQQGFADQVIVSHAKLYKADSNTWTGITHVTKSVESLNIGVKYVKFAIWTVSMIIIVFSCLTRIYDTSRILLHLCCSQYTIFKIMFCVDWRSTDESNLMQQYQSRKTLQNYLKTISNV